MFDQANCQITCPICRQSTQAPNASSLPINVELAELIERLVSFQEKQSQINSQMSLQFVASQVPKEVSFMDLTRGQLIGAQEGITRASRGENVKTLEDAADIIRPKMSQLVK